MAISLGHTLRRLDGLRHLARSSVLGSAPASSPKTSARPNGRRTDPIWRSSATPAPSSISSFRSATSCTGLPGSSPTSASLAMAAALPLPITRCLQTMRAASRSSIGRGSDSASAEGYTTVRGVAWSPDGQRSLVQRGHAERGWDLRGHARRRSADRLVELPHSSSCSISPRTAGSSSTGRHPSGGSKRCSPARRFQPTCRSAPRPRASGSPTMDR